MTTLYLLTTKNDKISEILHKNKCCCILVVVGKFLEQA
ncbi:MAG: hypothetical protein OJF59_002797 [Cytophagales bacterium]|nr:MAG: hypothetical protein OJF59_002797 [Cytophagales bacterium]